MKIFVSNYMFLISLFGASLAFAGAPVLELEILSVRPHNSDAYTQGLFFNGPYLYESSGRYGQSFFNRYNFANPAQRDAILYRLESGVFAEGAAIADGEIYLLSWREETAFVFDPDKLSLKRRLKYKGQGWGLAWDGEKLWRSDGSASLYPHRAGDMEPAGESILVHDQNRPVNYLNELEWDPNNRLILANIYTSDLVAAIDVNTGKVLFWLNGAPLRTLARKAGLDSEINAYDTVLNGLALAPDGKSLWLTGKLWPEMYEVAWPPKGMPAR